MLGGKWTYRSYSNRAALVGEDAAAALALIFGEGIFDLHGCDRTIEGALGMGNGYALTITGTIAETDIGGGRADTPGPPVSYTMIGLGIDRTATAGWRYDYHGILAPHPSQAVDQIPCLVGTVVRVNAHGSTAPAGVTASFIAVRHDDHPPPRTDRRFALLA